MVDIKIDRSMGENGYDAVAEYIVRFWDRSHPRDTIVSLGTSYDGKSYLLLKEIVFPSIAGWCDFPDDWWEGEQYIKLFGIKAVEDLDIDGGIYED